MSDPRLEDSALAWLQMWFEAQCNGSWEHSSGIVIETLDNPGWSLTIDLSGTELQHASMDELIEDRGDRDWLFCKVESGKFMGNGDIRKLSRLIECFRDWVTSVKTR